MAYIKNTWVDQDVERPKTYEVTNNADGSITLTDSFGLVTELGTPVNETNMNHIEDGIDGCAIRKHNLTETFDLGEWVKGGTGDDEGLYRSLVASNTGNAITDTTKWEKKYSDDKLLKHNQITNCILEAPSGVSTYSGSHATAKEGLKVLLPNGLNADGTLNNIEYTLSSDVDSENLTGQAVGFLQTRYFYIGENTAILCMKEHVWIQSSEPSLTDYQNNFGVWFNPDTNKTYRSNSGSWVETPLAVISIVYCSGNSITSQIQFNPVQLLKLNDKVDISSWSLRSSSKSIGLTLGSSGTQYTAPANGYIVLTLALNSGGHMNVGLLWAQNGTGNGAYNTLMYPVTKGLKFVIQYSNLQNMVNFKFYPCVGSESEVQ